MADTRGEIISFHSLCVTVLIHHAVVTSVSTFAKSLPILPANNLAVLGDANARRRNPKYLSYFLIFYLEYFTRTSVRIYERRHIYLVKSDYQFNSGIK